PAVSVGNTTIVEGNNGTVNAFFTVYLSNVSTQDVTVPYSTANGTATAGLDYTATSGAVTIPAGQTSRTLAVPVVANLAAQGNRTFFVNLGNPTNATLARAQAVGTIVDDDNAALMISMGDVNIQEGNAGTVNAVFPVYLPVASNSTVTVQYTTVDNTAVAGTDYIAQSGTVTFLPGQTTRPISIAVKSDAFVDGNRSFFVDLSNPVGATVARTRGTALILDDDGFSAIAVGDVTVAKGTTGTVD